jgi:hypothetical protein
MRPRESGYAFMMVVFFVALLAIAAMAAGPRILMEGKREKEQEMIWRGKQYVRGVKMYYRKMGRFPTSVDDLTKPKVGSLRFMRQAYKDPMNSGDGSWRLIYVGPAGQLIGSLKPPQTLQLPGAGGGLGTPASTLATNSAQQPGGLGSSTFGSLGNTTGAASGGAAANTNPQGNGQQNAQPNGDQANPQMAGAAQGGTPTDGTQAAGTDANGAPAGDAMSTPQAITPTESPNIIGGNIIGVGSKAVAPAVIVYEKAKNYHLFEFIWDPSKDVTISGQPGMQTGTGLGQNVGSNPGSFGQQQPGGTNPAPAGTPIPGTAGAPTPNNPPPNNPPEAPLDSTPPPEPDPQQ